jgi:hypothetical protein
VCVEEEASSQSKGGLSTGGQHHGEKAQAAAAARGVGHCPQPLGALPRARGRTYVCTGLSFEA